MKPVLWSEFLPFPALCTLCHTQLCCQITKNARIMTDTLLEHHFTHLCFLLRQYNRPSAAAMAAISMSGPCLFGITTKMKTPEFQARIELQSGHSSFAEQCSAPEIRQTTPRVAAQHLIKVSVCILSHSPVYVAYCNACKRAVFTCNEDKTARLKSAQFEYNVGRDHACIMSLPALALASSARADTGM